MSDFLEGDLIRSTNEALNSTAMRHRGDHVDNPARHERNKRRDMFPRRSTWRMPAMEVENAMPHAWDAIHMEPLMVRLLSQAGNNRCLTFDEFKKNPILCEERWNAQMCRFLPCEDGRIITIDGGEGLKYRSGDEHDHAALRRERVQMAVYIHPCGRMCILAMM